MLPGLPIFRTKSIKKPVWKFLPLGAKLFFYSFRLALPSWPHHDTQNLAKTPPTLLRRPSNSRSRTPPDRPEPCRAALNTRPKRPRPPIFLTKSCQRRTTKSTHLGRVLDRLTSVLDRLGSILGASQAVLVASYTLSGPFQTGRRHQAVRLLQ